MGKHTERRPDWVYWTRRVLFAIAVITIGTIGFAMFTGVVELGVPVVQE